MRIALICPRLPPEICGVGDYTAKLASELGKAGQEVAVWTRVPSQDVDASGFSRKVIPGPWQASQLTELRRQVAGWKPSLTVIQYTPYLFAPGSRGVRLSLPIWLWQLKRDLSCPLILSAHELHYPVGLDPRGILIGAPQAAQFLGAAMVADRVLFTYEEPAERYRRKFKDAAGRFSWLPVGANIEPHPESGEARSTDVSAERLLLHFGGLHPTHLTGHILHAFRKATSTSSVRARLVFVGSSSQEIEGKLKEHQCEDLKERITATGRLPTHEVSEWITRADLILAPFLDGISTRRGSVMAAFAHGKPVVSTTGWASGGTVPWNSFCEAVPGTDEERFADSVLALLEDETRRERLGRQAKDHYDANFAWPVLAKRFLEKATRSTGEGMSR